MFLIYLLSCIVFVSDIPLEYMRRWRDKQACDSNFFFVSKIECIGWL
jgi:hypothetical protein